MKTRIAIAAGALLALLGSMLVYAPMAQAAVGLRISAGRIVEANGQPFVARGTSHPHVWYQSQTSSFANIKSLRANAVRVVLGSGQRWGPSTAADVANVISLCKTNRLICVLEVHDTTGFGEEGAAASLDQAVSYWISVRSALVGQENFVILNIGNEPMGNNQTVNATWASATSSAIQRLRSNGFEHLIMVDAPNWGQDWQFIMRDNAQAVFNSDPQRNTVFSVHMYGVFDTAAEVTSYMQAFQTAGLPLVVGEFGFNHSDGNPDEDTIMAQAQQRGIGYFGWSWSGNGGGVEYLDQVTQFNVNALTPWGERLFNGANGIVATSREATVYGQPCSDTAPPTTPGTPAVSGITSSGATLTWAASTDSGCAGLAGYNVYREQGATDPVLGTPTANTVTLTGLAANTQYQVYVRARDNNGNLSGNSALVTFTTGGTPPPTGCRVAYSFTWTGGTGFGASASITNTSSAPINGWSLSFTLPSGQGFGGGWNGTWTPGTGGALTVRNESWNASIPAGGTLSQSPQFNGTYPGSGTPARPTSFTLNGVACTVA